LHAATTPSSGDAFDMKTTSKLQILAAALAAALTINVQADVPPDSQKPASPGDKPTVPGTLPGNGSDVPTVTPSRPGTAGEKPVATPPPNPPGNNGNK
jgi:hypothetical protein